MDQGIIPCDNCGEPVGPQKLHLHIDLPDQGFCSDRCMEQALTMQRQIPKLVLTSDDPRVLAAVDQLLRIHTKDHDGADHTQVHEAVWAWLENALTTMLASAEYYAMSPGSQFAGLYYKALSQAMRED